MNIKRNKKVNTTKRLNRKQIRKEKRKEKKTKRSNYYMKRGKNFASAESKAIAEQLDTSKNKPLKNASDGHQVLSTEAIHKKEKKEQKRIQKGMTKQRKEQLLKANEQEDREIRKLEKLLKLDKRKSKSVPKSFCLDGLDYLLEVCDPEFMKKAGSAELDLNDGNDEFEEDFELMTGKLSKNRDKKKTTHINNGEDSNEEEDSDDFEDLLNEGDVSEGEELSDHNSHEDLSTASTDTDSEITNEENIKKQSKKSKNNSKKQEQSIDSDDGSTTANSEKNKCKKVRKKKKKHSDENMDENYESGDVENVGKRKLSIQNSETSLNKKSKKNKVILSNSTDEDELSDLEMDNASQADESVDKDDHGVWEDIYGRLRSKDGAIISKTEGKYIPPAIRAKMEAGSGSEDKKRKEKLERLKKQIKGLLNRLAESNMHNIASQIEDLYMNNSRNDMSETLTSLMVESLISAVSTPERLLMEHVLLIAVLHANIGTEVGAYFLQTIVKKFDEITKINPNIEDKSLDNTVNILAQLYNFKLFDAKLVYEILQRLTDNFDEKNVECILHILRSVGFSLRKDDPLALKSLILELQKQAAKASEGKGNNSRVKFLLDVLLAIKNNNVTKIPNYDTTYSEHLKKIMKGFIRKGNYVTPLNISLEDLLKADERGKWWVVGSAWTGNIENPDKKDDKKKSDAFSQQLLDLARKQRMNTDTRRDIFCIIMSAEDYLDAFERLLRLGLKNQQEREIIHVLLHCCLQEKVFNPYYAILAQKFCEYDRKFQMIIKCSVWDKLKTLSSHSGAQLSNLAKLLIHLFIEKGLPISTLKILEFSELDKVTLRVMRQILLGILLHDDLEAVQGVFENVARSDKLKMFRESLRLFIHHFLLRNLKVGSVPEEQKQNLEERAKMVEKILTVKDSRLKL